MGKIKYVESLSDGILMMNENSARARRDRKERRHQARVVFHRHTFYVYGTRHAAMENDKPLHTFIVQTERRAAARAALRMRRKKPYALVGKIVYIRRAGSRAIGMYRISGVANNAKRWVAQTTSNAAYPPPSHNRRDFDGKSRAKVEYVGRFERPARKAAHSLK